MKKKSRSTSKIPYLQISAAVFLILFGVITFIIARVLPKTQTTPEEVAAAPAQCNVSFQVLGVCNDQCAVDTDCNKSLVCYKKSSEALGVCRDHLNPAQPECKIPSPVPHVTPTPSPRPTSSPVPQITPWPSPIPASARCEKCGTAGLPPGSPAYVCRPGLVCASANMAGAYGKCVNPGETYEACSEPTTSPQPL